MAMEPYLGLFLAIPFLIAMAFCDLRYMEIPKWVSRGFIAIFVVMAFLVVPWMESAARLAVAGGVFAAGFAAFALRLIGGGDVKALSALMLLIPTSSLTVFMLALAACLMVGVVAVLMTRRLCGGPQTEWEFLRSAAFPMGISIAGAGLVLPMASVIL